MFEKASRLKLRFETSAGLLSTEDLWNLPLKSTAGRPNLNSIAQGLSRKIKDDAQEDFVDSSGGVDPKTDLAFDIVKHIIKVRLEENAAAEAKKDLSRREQALLAAIDEAENKELTTGSVADLRAKLAALRAG